MISPNGKGNNEQINNGESSLFPLSIVLEYRETYAGMFDPSDKLVDICQKALHDTWKTRSQLGEWKITDRYGRELSMYSRLEETGVPPQDTIYMSKRLGDVSDQNLLVTVEDKVEQKL